MWSATTDSDSPRYQQIAANLRERIRGGEYAPGALLPTHPQLGEQYGVSLITVRHAVRLLVEEGLVRTVAGKGTIATAGVHAEVQPDERCVGVLLPNYRAWTALHPALFEELHDLGHEILMKPLPREAEFASEPERVQSLIQALRSACGGGLILFGDRRLAETFLRERRPDEVGVCLENVNGIPSSLPMAGTDNFGGTFALTRHLLALGHTRIAYLEGMNPNWNRTPPVTSRARRFAGYRAALQSDGRAPCIPDELVDLVWHHPDREKLARLMRRPDMPTALVCWNDKVAERVHARLAEAQIAVPGEVSLTGYDNDNDPALRGGDWLTTLDQNGPEIARQLVRLLHEERERPPRGREEAAPRILVPPVLHIRGSVAPPRK
jgi:DNA-binding LacI/PurR family transcriptional regulator/DNA-binding transcriptional regulator YhcF (GntR family)